MTHEEFAIKLARQAGQIIKENFVLGMPHELKDDSTPVTKTDLAINELVMEEVEANFPEYGLIGEEGSNYSGQKYTWICDPVDGTIPFSRGIPVATFMLALIEDGVSILGVIYDPFLDRMFYAEKGKGAFLNGEKISVSAEDINKTAISLLTWKGAKFDLRDVYPKLLETTCFTFDLEAVGYVMGLIASGQIGALIFSGTHSYDSAAAKVIIDEAGGKVTDLYGNEPDFREDINGCIASNGVLHAELLEMVKESL
jgi:fructose-1,6-bisphosphatase/inositol monophosphatase family enzyme